MRQRSQYTISNFIKMGSAIAQVFLISLTFATPSLAMDNDVDDDMEMQDLGAPDQGQLQAQGMQAQAAAIPAALPAPAAAILAAPAGVGGGIPIWPFVVGGVAAALCGALLAYGAGWGSCELDHMDDDDNDPSVIVEQCFNNCVEIIQCFRN